MIKLLQLRTFFREGLEQSSHDCWCQTGVSKGNIFILTQTWQVLMQLILASLEPKPKYVLGNHCYLQSNVHKKWTDQKLNDGWSLRVELEKWNGWWVKETDRRGDLTEWPKTIQDLILISLENQRWQGNFARLKFGCRSSLTTLL